MNPSLKLYFYTSILTNNTILLKIYCENIMIIFVISYFLYYVFFFSCFFPTTHVYPCISIFYFSSLLSAYSRTSLSFFFQLSRHLFLCEDQSLSFPNQFQTAFSFFFFFLLSHRHRMIGLKSSGVQADRFLPLLFFIFLSNTLSILINYYKN